MHKTLVSTLIWLGMLLILTGIVLPFFTPPGNMVHAWIFAAGALLNLAGRILTRYDGPLIRVKRLLRIETWAALFFCAAAWFMFTDPNPRSWIVFVLAGGALLVYTSIMIPYVQRKSDQN